MQEVIENQAGIDPKVGSGETDVEKSVLASAPQKKPIHRFKPGVSGNPNGRPKGSVSPATRFRNKLAEHGDELLELALAQVRKGEGKSNTLLVNLLTFVVGQQRGELAAVSIPAMAEAKTYEDKLLALEAAVVNGEISPDASKLIVDQLKTSEEAKQLRILNDELAILKAKVIEGSARRVA